MIYQVHKRGVGWFLLLVFLLSGCELDRKPTPAVDEFHFSDWIMGTTFSIKASDLPGDFDQDQLKVEIMALLVDIDATMSTYKSDSELSNLNRHQARTPLIVSKSLFQVFAEAQRINRLSGGAFDITIGRLVNLWGFGPEQPVTEAPDQALIDQSLAASGHKQLVLDDKNLTISKLHPDLYLDLSALAKGYAVDRVAELLKNKQIDNFLVEIGGELKLNGHNKDNKPWRIAVEKPTAERRAIQKVIELTDIGIASSGDYRNFFEQNGQRYSHTIDPRSGRSISHNLVSVTVLHQSTMTADALATAFMVLGAEAGLVMAEREKIAVLFYVKSDNDFIEQRSTAYQKFFKVKS